MHATKAAARPRRFLKNLSPFLDGGMVAESARTCQSARQPSCLTQGIGDYIGMASSPPSKLNLLGAVGTIKPG
jgi:hypothetical protein